MTSQTSKTGDVEFRKSADKLRRLIKESSATLSQRILWETIVRDPNQLIEAFIQEQIGAEDSTFLVHYALGYWENMADLQDYVRRNIFGSYVLSSERSPRVIQENTLDSAHATNPTLTRSELNTYFGSSHTQQSFEDFLKESHRVAVLGRGSQNHHKYVGNVHSTKRSSRGQTSNTLDSGPEADRAETRSVLCTYYVGEQLNKNIDDVRPGEFRRVANCVKHVGDLVSHVGQILYSELDGKLEMPPYTPGTSQWLGKVPSERQHTSAPFISEDGIYYSPGPGAEREYFEQMRSLLNELNHARGNRLGNGEILDKIARFYQLGISLLPFNYVNNSVFMVMANVLLETYGFNPIPHLYLDTLAQGLDTDYFSHYFRSTVSEVGINILEFRAGNRDAQVLRTAGKIFREHVCIKLQA